MKHRGKLLLVTAGLMLSLIAILCACTGPTETNTGTSSETAGSATGTETGTEAVTGTETGSAAADTDTQTETETKPTVSEDAIGIANVANAGYAMAGSCRNTDGYSNLHANDNDLSTPFSSQDFSAAESDVYLFVDLTRAYTVRSVVLLPAAGEAELFPVDFDLQVSDDGQAWTTVQSRTDVSGVGEAGVTVDMAALKRPLSACWCIGWQRIRESTALHWARCRCWRTCAVPITSCFARTTSGSIRILPLP